ncbi:MAG: glycosyltransferase family 39 protein [Candidatus Binatia bacterium]|nr:glycosyltransferase family 39 protein [Candidatus Binatia bacterium]
MRWWLAFLVLTVLYLSRLDGWVLQDPDEGRYAEIPREMIESGDWLTPRLNYVNYFEKPPLLYWAIATAFTVFGQSEGVARLVPALSALACIALTYLLGTWLLSRRAAFFGSVLLGTSPLFFAFSQGLVIDMLLTALLTAVLVAFLAAHRATSKTPWVLAAALASGAAVLAKGLIGLVIPGTIALAFLAVSRDWITTKAFLSWKPIALFLAVTVPWFALVSSRNPEFLEFFFLHEHLRRFASDVGHPEGPLYYLPVLFLGALPWTLMFSGLAFSGEARSAAVRIPREAVLFLGLWAGIVLVFFSLASSKLAGYILPAFPPLALLAGAWVDEMSEARVFKKALSINAAALLSLSAVALVVSLAGVTATGAIAEAFRFEPQDVRALAAALGWCGVVVALVLLVHGALARRGRAGSDFAFVATAFAVALALTAAIEARAILKTSYVVAEVARERLAVGEQLVAYKILMQGLPYYTGERVVMVDYAGEIWHGAKHASDRQAFFWSKLHQLVDAWAARPLLLVTKTSRLEELREILVPPPVVLVQDRDRVLLGREVDVPADESASDRSS